MAAIAAVIVLPVYLLSYVHPSVTRLVTDHSIAESKRIAGHFTYMFFSGNAAIKKDSLPPEFLSNIDVYRKNFGIMKVKVYDAAGVAVYSTDPGDIGKLNEHAYYKDIVAKGIPYGKFVKKKGVSLEGQSFEIDVVETYVPIMQDGGFAGSFEIYLDVTEELGGVHGLIRRSSLALFIVALFLTVAVAITAFKAKKSIIEKNKIQEEIMQAKRDWEETFDTITDMITIHDAEFNIIKANKAAEKLLGKPLETIQQAKCFESYHGTGKPPEGCPSCKCLITGEPAHFEIFEPHLNMFIEIRSIPRFDLNRKLVGLIHIVRDITERKTIEEKLKTISITDELTGLYNRRGFFALAEQQTRLNERAKSNMLLFFADLDKMKEINDKLGHEEGDRALRDTSAILKEVFRKSDIIARMGGDEFAVLMVNAGKSDGAIVESRLADRLTEFNGTSKRGYNLSLSIGAAAYNPEAPLTLDEMVRAADKEMYENKKSHKAARE